MKSVFSSTQCHKVVRYVDRRIFPHLHIILSSIFSALFLFLVFVTLSTTKKEGSNDCAQKNMERKNVYTFRFKKIQKVCKKYGLSASDEGKIPITKSKMIQSYHTIPPFNDKVNYIKNNDIFTVM